MIEHKGRRLPALDRVWSSLWSEWGLYSTQLLPNWPITANLWPPKRLMTCGNCQRWWYNKRLCEAQRTGIRINTLLIWTIIDILLLNYQFYSVINPQLVRRTRVIVGLPVRYRNCQLHFSAFCWRRRQWHGILMMQTLITESNSTLYCYFPHRWAWWLSTAPSTFLLAYPLLLASYLVLQDSTDVRPLASLYCGGAIWVIILAALGCHPSSRPVWMSTVVGAARRGELSNTLRLAEHICVHCQCLKHSLHGASLLNTGSHVKYILSKQ